MEETLKPRDICFLDTETTGKEVETARIVELCIVKMSHDLAETKDIREALINPGMLIPAEASTIHGITDEKVKDLPLFVRYAKAIFDFMKGCDLAGFNICGFDIPVLSEEFARCGIVWPESGTRFYDSMQIFHLKEKRDLAGASMFYLGETHEDAHGAKADTLKTVDVFKAQLASYKDLSEMNGDQLHRFCMGEFERLDLAGKIVLIDGKACYSFGKDKGKSVKEFPGYAHWMLKQSFPTNTKNILKALING